MTKSAQMLVDCINAQAALAHVQLGGWADGVDTAVGAQLSKHRKVARLSALASVPPAHPLAMMRPCCPSGSSTRWSCGSTIMISVSGTAGPAV